MMYDITPFCRFLSRRFFFFLIESGNRLVPFTRVRTLLSSSYSMTFFHDLFKFSKALGLVVTFQNFQSFPCFGVFF